MDIPRLRLLAGTAVWAVQHRTRGRTARITRYDVETTVLTAVCLAMATGALVLLAQLVTRGQS